MSLARAWRRQLYGASSAALIVPSAMLAALVVLALGGGFPQVGVLGQIFAGPSAPSAAGGTVAGGSGGVAARSLPAIPTLAVVSSHPGAGRDGAARGRRAHGAHRGVVPVPSRGPSQTGGALAPVRGVGPIVSAGEPAPSVPGPPMPSPPQAPPRPGPSPKPTVVDRTVKAVTPITQQVPAPAGPAATQAIQDAGSAADNLLASGAPAPPSRLKLP
jgi:hypothetical protein